MLTVPDDPGDQVESTSRKKTQWDFGQHTVRGQVCSERLDWMIGRYGAQKRQGGW